MDAQRNVLVVNPWPSPDSVVDDIQGMYFGEIPIYITAVVAVVGTVLLIRSLGGK